MSDLSEKYWEPDSKNSDLEFTLDEDGLGVSTGEHVAYDVVKKEELSNFVKWLMLHFYRIEKPLVFAKGDLDEFLGLLGTINQYKKQEGFSDDYVNGFIDCLNLIKEFYRVHGKSL